MGKVIIDITMSLDGFIAATDIIEDQPMGKDGQRLHHWLFGAKTATDEELLHDLMEAIGAVILGNRTYTTAINKAWEGISPFEVPAFVICNDLPGTTVKGFSYVIDGIIHALKKAKEVAGEKNIWIMGGADIIQQYLKARLVDELHVHIAPVLFCGGTQLFDHTGTTHIELNKIKVANTPEATHMKFEIVK
jgi:dihydrofolate reductase